MTHLSSRALRRLAKRSRPAPPKRRQRALIPMAVKMLYVMDPLERILEDIERTGSIEVANGQPVFRRPAEASQVAYEMVPAIEGMADFFEMFSSRRGNQLELTGLRQFARKLDRNMPLTQGNIDAARADMRTMRQLSSRLTQAEADDLILNVQIKAELEKGGRHADMQTQ